MIQIYTTLVNLDVKGVMEMINRHIVIFNNYLFSFSIFLFAAGLFFTLLPEEYGNLLEQEALKIHVLLYYIVEFLGILLIMTGTYCIDRATKGTWWRKKI